MTAPGTPNTLQYRTHSAEVFSDLVGKLASTTLQYKTHSAEAYDAALVGGATAAIATSYVIFFG